MRALAAGLFLLLASPRLFAAASLTISGTTGVGSIDPGAPVETTFLVANGGPDAARDATFTVTLPAGVRVDSFGDTAGWSCAATAPGIVCTIAAMPFRPPEERAIFIARLVFDESVGGTVLHLPIAATAANSAPATRFVRVEVRQLFRVSTTADSGPGSLREAIAALNAGCAFDCKIVFELPAGSLIEPLAPLPAITACAQVWLPAGNTTREGDRGLELSGARQPAGHGLEYRAACTGPVSLSPSLHVEGIAINRFPGDGVYVEGGQFFCFGCFVGTDVTGRQARPNGGRGITIQHPFSGAWVLESVLSGNARSGMFIWDASRVTVERSSLGAGADGVPLPNGASGIFIRKGFLSATQSTIANNAHFGIAVGPEATMLTFGTSLQANGVQPIDYGLDGPTRHAPNMPDVPELTSATYDAATNTTRVRGRVTITRPHGYRHALAFYTSTRNLIGDTPILGPYNLPFRAETRPYDFEIPVAGDLRGRLLSAALSRGYDEESQSLEETSELSNGVVVR